MAFPFSNAIVGGGGSLVRPAIKSPNFVSGSTGWTINQDGTAEFQSLTARGNIIAGSLTAGTIGSSSIVNSTMTGGSISETNITFDTGGGTLLVYATTTVTTAFNSSGTFIVPAGITSATLKAWGGGGGAAGGGKAGGANSGGYGGGGGAYSETVATVTPGDTLTVTVGGGGAGGAANNLGSNGADSKVVNGSATTLVLAKAGKATTVNSPSAGGSASGGIGSILFSGGNGGSATGQGGSGGGGAAGNSGAGGAGGSTSTNTGGTAGIGNDSGASGGAGGNTNVNGVGGGSPGGGGGGGGGAVGSAGSGGAGGAGKVFIVYTSASTLIASVAPASGTDSFGNAYPQGIAGFSHHAVPEGIVAAPTGTSSNGTATSAGTEVRDAVLGNYVFTAITGRRYRVVYNPHVNTSATAASIAAIDHYVVNIRDGGAGTPTTASTLVATNTVAVPVGGGPGQVGVIVTDTYAPGAGTVTLGAFTQRINGAGTGTPVQSRSLWAEDIGAI